MNLTDPDIIATIEAALAGGRDSCAFTVQGEPIVRRVVSAAQPMEPGPQGYWPPAEWVALTGPCETCEDDYRRMVSKETHQCNGRKRVTFAVTCPHQRLGPPLFSGGNYGYYGEQKCLDCGKFQSGWSGAQEGFNDLVSAAVAVLPVVSEHDYQPGTVAVEITDQGLLLAHVSVDGVMTTIRLDLDRKPTPGRDFVVVLDGMVAP